MAYKSLQIAVTEFLQEKINNVYKEVSGDTLDFYKFSTILDWNFDEFKHYDEDGKLVVNKYNFHERYIPVIVDGLVGDVEPVPNSFIVNANIPITMLVNLEDVDLTLLVVNKFLKDSIGKLYELDFKESDETQNYKIAFSVSLPDYSDFNFVQGEYTKEVSFDIACVISYNVYWGNSIEYSLSIDNGVTYTKLYKIEPGVKRESDLYTNQIINQDYAKSSVRANAWNKSFSILGQNNELCNYLIKYIDFGSQFFGLEPIKAKLKIKYNGVAGFPYDEDDDVNTFVKDVVLNELSYSDNIGDFITININMVDSF